MFYTNVPQSTTIAYLPNIGVIQSSFDSNGRTHTQLRNEVVSACMTDFRKSVILAYDPYVDALIFFAIGCFKCGGEVELSLYLFKNENSKGKTDMH